MILELKRSCDWYKEYRCELTKELDKLSNISKHHYYDYFYHYILADDYCKGVKCLAIRVPGGTVGGITVDDNNVITSLVIDTDYVVKTYPSNINTILKKYIGRKIKYNEIIDY